MSRLVLFSAASFAALALAACGDNMSSNTAATVTPTQTADVSPDHDAAVRKTQDFINAAGQAGLVEIRTSELALQKSKDADVKAFAQMMIDQHKATGDKLKAAASTAGLAAPIETLDDFHMHRINDLIETDGDADFDADYMHLQVDAHNDAIKLFEDFSKDGQAIPQLKTFADEALPTLTAHKAEAARINDLVKKAGDKSTPS